MRRGFRNAMFMIYFLIALLVIPLAYGKVTMFTNRQSFEAAAPNLTNINFASVLAPGQTNVGFPGQMLTLNGVNFQVFASAGTLGVIAPSYGFPYQAWNTNPTVLQSPGNVGTTLVVTLPSGTKAVGTDIYTIQSTISGTPNYRYGAPLDVTLGNGQTFTIQTSDKPTLAFVGFTSDEPISSLTFYAPTVALPGDFPGGYVNLANFAFGASGGLGAPTNVHATQIGSSGDQIQLTWDYGSDPIDGFKIERKTPSGNWVELSTHPSLATCGSTSTGLTCAYPDNGLTPYATYSYRIRAFRGTENSDYAQVTTCFQVHVFVLNQPFIDATFMPDLDAALPSPLDTVASVFGYDHFNWLNWVDYLPYSWTGIDGKQYTAPPAFFDPPPDGWAYVDPTNNLPNPLPALVGVHTDGTFDVLHNFPWYSNFNPKTTAGGVVFRSFNLEALAGIGGIFNVQQNVATDDLPLDLRLSLIQLGAQNVSGAPKVDKDAPMTASFFSGPQGANGWYTGSVQVTLIATDIDGPSDVTSTTYSVNGGAVTSYAGPFTVSGDGIHTVQFGSMDRAGNAETPRPSQTINIDGTPPNTSCTASPNTLWPPNGKPVTVTISGTAADATSGLDASASTYAVTDEYSQVQPRGTVLLGAGGSYSVGVSLIAGRNGTDLDGRTYTIVVQAKDKAGNLGSCSAVVTVPHDRGH